MAQVTLDLTVEELRKLNFQLSPLDLIRLAGEIQERAETFQMMSLAESGFAEWNEPGEDIYWMEEPMGAQRAGPMNTFIWDDTA